MPQVLKSRLTSWMFISSRNVAALLIPSAPRWGAFFTPCRSQAQQSRLFFLASPSLWIYHKFLSLSLSLFRLLFHLFSA